MTQTTVRTLSLALLLLGSAVAASAAEIELTPFYGYRFGGDFDHVPGFELEIEDGDAYGIALGFATSEESQIELLWSRQETDLQVKLVAEPQSTFGLTVDRYHIGGLYLPPTGDDALRPFVTFSLGITVFNPSEGKSEDKFSVSLGGGLKYYFGDHVGLRLQALWTPTYINSTAEGIFCGPFTCYVVEDSHYVQQIEVSAGLIIGF